MKINQQVSSMSEPQIRKRVRKRSVTLMIQEALNTAASLEKLEPTELSIARMKLVQTRLNVLEKMQARERFDKITELTRRVEELSRRVDELTAENNRLQESHPIRDPEVESALARHYAAVQKRSEENNVQTDNEI